MTPAARPLLALVLLLAASTAARAQPAAAHWTAPTTGAWTDPTKWSTNPAYPNNASPQPTDTYDAILDATGTAHTVTLDQSIALNGLTLDSANVTLRHTAGVLTVPTLTLAAGSYELAGGHVSGAALSVAPAATMTVTAGTLDAVTLDGGANIPASGWVRIRNGLTLNGTLTANGGSLGQGSGVAFMRTQTLAGTGAIVFNGTDSVANTVSISDESAGQDPVLTVGAGVTVRTGTQGGFFGTTGGGAAGVVNHGTLAAQTAGKTLTVGQLKSSDGALSATNGGRLVLQNVLGGNLGQVTLAANSKLEATGAYTVDQPITAPAGSLLSLGGTWNNLAAINATDAEIYLGTPAGAGVGSVTITNGALGLIGTLTTAQLRAMNLSNTFVKVAADGTLQNTGDTLALDAGTGSYHLSGGKILGGTVTGTGGARLVADVPPASMNNVIDGATLDTDVAVANGGRLVVNNVTLQAGRTLSLETGNAAATTLVLGALSGAGEIVFNGTNFGGLVTGAVLPAGITLRTGTQSGTVGNATDTLTNRGLISARSGRTLIVAATLLTDTGTLEAKDNATLNVRKLSGNLGNVNLTSGATLDLDGTYTNNLPRTLTDNTTLVLRGNWSNPAGISATNATLAFGTLPANRGPLTITNATLGVAGNLTTAQILSVPHTTSGLAVLQGGTLNNANNTLTLDANTPSLLLKGGTVSGGTIAAPPGAPAVNVVEPSTLSPNTLSAVTLAADLTVQPRAVLTTTNGLTVAAGTTVHLISDGSPGTMNISGAQTWGGAGQILFDSATTSFAVVHPGNTTLTIGPGLLVGTGTGYGSVGNVFLFSTNGTVINQGTISARTAGRGVVIANTNFTNTGLVEARNGASISVTSRAKLTNLANGTLTGGTWAAYANSGFWLTTDNAPITTNAATVILSGPGSDFREITALQTNHGAFTVTDGRAFTTAGALANHGTLTLGPDAALAVTGPLTGAGTTTVAPTAHLTAGAIRQNTLHLNGQATLRPAAQGGQTSALNALNLGGDFGAWTARLDLADTALVLHYTDPSPLARTASQIRSAYHGGDWQGPGLATSAATATTALGYGEAADLLGFSGDQTATFAGQTVDATTVVVRLTRRGDANLDGQVDFADLVRLAQHYNVVSPAAAYWPDGDFTYDGVVDFADLVQLAQNYNAPAPALAGAPAAFQSDLAAAFASVPEPTGAALLALTALTFRRRARGATRPAGSEPTFR